MKRSSVSEHTTIFMSALLVLLPLVLLGCPQEDNPAADMGAGDMNTPSDADMSGGGGDGTDDRDDGGQQDELSIESVSPATGSVSGGLEVLVRGSGFGAGTRVYFGADEGSSVDVRSPTQLVVTTPAVQAIGAVDVRVELTSGESVTLAGGFTYEDEVVVETPLYCRLQAQSPYRAVVGQQDAEQLYVVIFADGKTQGVGQGSGVEAELGVGEGDAYEGYTYAAMTYNVDKDGLNAGDLANDEYGALPPLDVAGSFGYAARVRVDGGDWLYCDLDGSDNGVSAEQLGQLEVTEEQVTPPTISYCQLLPSVDPLEQEIGVLGAPITVRVFSEGVTQGAGSSEDVIEGELGYGSSLADLDALSYVPLAYASDADGLNAGDLANDDYQASLLVTDAGTYRYVARFRVSDEPASDWFYCDLDGHSDTLGFEVEQAGTINVTEPAVPSIGFCRTETAQLPGVTPGEETAAVTGVVYVQGLTEGAGQGAGITSELVWGVAGSDPQTWSSVEVASYLEDTDGLNAGDLANDRYTTTITTASEGDFEFAYRFSLDGGQNWVWCDTDGSSQDATSFETDKLGAFEVASSNLADSCRIQFPFIVQQAQVGSSLDIYGRVFEQGVTDVGDDDAMVSMELWVGPVSADPLTEASRFSKTPMSYNVAMPASATEDEYVASWTPLVGGSYKFLLRASVDGGANHTFCDMDGGSFEQDKVGAAEVFLTPQDQIDYCHVFQGMASWSPASLMYPIYTMEVYEGGVTPNNGGANSAMLEAEVGYGEQGVNPALNGAYVWSPAPFSQVNPGNGNNYEYQGSPLGIMNVPAAGTYDVAMRVRRTGQGVQQWVYCDNLSLSGDFLIGAVSKLEVMP